MPYAIAAGDATTGMSIFQIETGMDTGPGRIHRELPDSPPHDTTNTVLTKLSELAPMQCPEFSRRPRAWCCPGQPPVRRGELRADSSAECRGDVVEVTCR